MTLLTMYGSIWSTGAPEDPAPHNSGTTREEYRPQQSLWYAPLVQTLAQEGSRVIIEEITIAAGRAFEEWLAGTEHGRRLETMTTQARVEAERDNRAFDVQRDTNNSQWRNGLNRLGEQAIQIGGRLAIARLIGSM